MSHGICPSQFLGPRFCSSCRGFRHSVLSTKVACLPVDSIGHGGVSCLPFVGPIVHVFQSVQGCLTLSISCACRLLVLSGDSDSKATSNVSDRR